MRTADCLAPPCRADRRRRWEARFYEWEKVAREPEDGAEEAAAIRAAWLRKRGLARARRA